MFQLELEQLTKQGGVVWRRPLGRQDQRPLAAYLPRDTHERHDTQWGGWARPSSATQGTSLLSAHSRGGNSFTQG
jgi:hypothetical protein